MARLIHHLFAPHWVAARTFPRRTLDVIQAAISESEKHHAGELRFAIEAGLEPTQVLRGLSARERALQVFSALRVWDTEHNNGVLVYVQLVDRRIEIVADRGINAKVDQSEWDGVCRDIEAAYRNGDFERGSVDGVRRIGELLMRHFPSDQARVNELPDRPVLL